MALRTHLFSENTRWPQLAVVGSWYANLLIVCVLWAASGAAKQFTHGLGPSLVAIGDLLGIVAAVFALTQFLLMARIRWIERPFGLDHLASYHRFNGYAAIIAILLHPVVVIAGYAVQSKMNYIAQYKQVVLHYEDAWLAFIGSILFVLVVISSIYLVRKHLKFERWYYVHLAVYIAITITFLHQFALGTTFQGHPLAKLYWFAMYLFVAFNVLVFRFGVPSYRMFYHDFRISRVVPETATTTSVYIHVKHFEKWQSKAGQFILIRILSKERFWQEHPFSLSMVPANDELRLTIRASGDYTQDIAKLKPGARVLVSGPFGRFTSELAETEKRLFIAGGVGITPLRALAEEALESDISSILLYANRTPDDVALEAEIQMLSEQGLQTAMVFSDPPAAYKGESGRLSNELVARLVPDYKDRDIYLCGPPPMMASLVADFTAAGVLPARLHFENFALHN